MDIDTLITLAFAGIGVLAGIIFGISNYRLQKRNYRLQEKIVRLEESRDNRETQEKRKTEQLTITAAEQDRQDLLRYWIDKMQFIDFAGFKAMNAKPVLLEKIYIRLKAAFGGYAIDEQRLAKLEQSGEEQEQQGIEKNDPFEIETLFRKITDPNRESPGKLLILGKPGSGKTTLLKYLAIKTAKLEEPYRGYTPIFIRLHEWIGLNNWEAMDIQASLKGTGLVGGNRLRFFDESAKQGNILYLFDGLDEIADEEIRRRAIEWFQRMDFGKNPVIITSRFTGLSEEKNLRFNAGFIDNYVVMDLDRKLIEEFCRNWYELYETHATEERDREQSLKVAKNNSQEMIDDLFADVNASILILARIPMLLTMIALVYKLEYRLPRDRHELYKHIIELMADSYRFKFKHAAADYPFEKDIIIRHLASLARGLTEANSRAISLSQACDFFPKKIEGQDAAYFLDQMIERIGLLYRSEGQTGFIHLSFQEYLTAHQFKTQASNPLDMIRKHRESYWHEPIRLLFSSADENLRTAFLTEAVNGMDSEGQFHRSMNLWEDCLGELAEGDQRRKLEIGFGRQLLGKMLNMEKTDDDGIWNTSLYYGFHFYPKEYISILDGGISNDSHPYLKDLLLRLRLRAAKPEEKAAILHKPLELFLQTARESGSASSVETVFANEALPRFVFLSGDFLPFYKLVKNLQRCKLEFQCLVYTDLRFQI